jgi:peptide-methionine (S)-S-oxide reductase
MQVESQKTGHAQVVRLEFAPDTISYADILDIFWVIHDPTSLNRKAYDIGPQYRSIILYEGISQKQTAESSRARAAKLFSKPIVTEIVPLDHFYEAESYHQNYYNNHPDQGYCQIIINPKLQKLREKFTARLKPELA